MADRVYRSGFGYDVHRLAEGHRLILGGVEIPSEGIGTVAHSDGDVLVHAICDALLGAGALGDIGIHFPDTDERYRGIDSMVLLSEVQRLVEGAGFNIVNIDATVVLERPKLSPFRSQIEESICSRLGLATGDVSVKATTNEQLGPIGAGEGVAAFAVAMVRR